MRASQTCKCMERPKAEVERGLRVPTGQVRQRGSVDRSGMCPVHPPRDGSQTSAQQHRPGHLGAIASLCKGQVMVTADPSVQLWLQSEGKIEALGT